MSAAVFAVARPGVVPTGIRKTNQSNGVRTSAGVAPRRGDNALAGSRSHVVHAIFEPSADVAVVGDSVRAGGAQYCEWVAPRQLRNDSEVERQMLAAALSGFLPIGAQQHSPLLRLRARARRPRSLFPTHGLSLFGKQFRGKNTLGKPLATRDTSIRTHTLNRPGIWRSFRLLVASRISFDARAHGARAAVFANEGVRTDVSRATLSVSFPSLVYTAASESRGKTGAFCLLSKEGADADIHAQAGLLKQEVRVTSNL